MTAYDIELETRLGRTSGAITDFDSILAHYTRPSGDILSYPVYYISIDYCGTNEAIKIAGIDPLMPIDGALITVGPSGVIFDNYVTTASFGGDLYNAIQNLLSTDPTIAAYLEVLRTSMISTITVINDGTPQSSTAKMADAITNDLAFTSIPEISANFDSDFATPENSPTAGIDTAENDTAPASQSSQSRAGDIGFGVNSGQFKLGGLHGTYADFGVPFSGAIAGDLSYIMTLSFSYLNIESTDVFGVGINAGLPYRLSKMSADDRWNWKLIPVVGAQMRFDADSHASTAVASIGFANSVDFRVNSKLIVSLVNQISTYKSSVIDHGNTGSYPDISQHILRNGLRAVTPLTRRLFLEGFVFETHFLKDAAVDNYTTLGTALSFRLTKGGNATLGFNYDFGKHYHSWGLGIKSVWNF